MMANIHVSNKELQDYLFTLEVCKKSLPLNTHSIHRKRLDNLINQIERQIGYSDEYVAIRQEVESQWEDYKKETYNNNFATSKHARKIEI